MSAVLFYLLPVLPALPALLIHILAAVLPAVFLLRYVCFNDTIEPEPPGLLAKLLFGGVIAALASGALENIGESVLRHFVQRGSPAYIILFAFLVVAAVEEITKFLALRRMAWNDPAFDYLFDGVVYAAFVSLGFAAFENIHYEFSYGLSVALPRAVLAIPGHLSFSVFMGVYFGRARRYANRGNFTAARFSMIFGCLFAVFLHGFYDACAMLGTTRSTVTFLIFVLIMFTGAFRTLKRESRRDMPV